MAAVGAKTSAGGVTGRSRVCSTFTSVAEVAPWAFDSSGPRKRWKALRVVERRHRSCGPAGSDPKRSVQRKAGSCAESEQNAASRANLGDPKRVKRHEARLSPASGRKLGGPENDVELGFSIFEKVGCSPESSAHLATKTLS
jgi:hypothetical protein